MGSLFAIGFLGVVVWAVMRHRPRTPAAAGPPSPLNLTGVTGLDVDALGRWSAVLKSLGFSPLCSFDLPHLRTAAARLGYAAFSSADGERLATIGFRVQGGRCYVHVFFTTWFEDGLLLITTNLTFSVVNFVKETIRVVHGAEWDLGKLQSSHDERLAALKAAGHRAIRVDAVETLSALLARDHEREVAAAVATGGYRIEGDRVVRTFAGDLQLLKGMFSPIAPDRSALWHAGLGIMATSAGVAAAFGVPFQIGLLFGLFAGFTLGFHGVSWVIVTIAVALGAGAGAAEVNSILGSFLVGFSFGSTARFGAGRRGVARFLPSFSRPLGIVLGALLAVTCASRTLMVAARGEVHILPTTYRGPVVITYGVPGATRARKNRLRVEYDVPPSGLLSVSDTFRSANDGFRRFTFYRAGDRSLPLAKDRRRSLLSTSMARVCRLQILNEGGKTLLAYFVGSEPECDSAGPAILDQVHRAAEQPAAL